ncbi:hypothetical protein [Micromonospora gifhornensis]|uniref:hypothetical protein n=1 Tax=Micromonospora gifhornensis TaxID=84594 RepID=UPI003D719B0E
MTTHTLTPRPGFERYTIQVGWNPHHTYFATVADFTNNPTTNAEREPINLQLGLIETILDPSEVLRAVEPYAVIPADLTATLHADQAAHPPRRSLNTPPPPGLPSPAKSDNPAAHPPAGPGLGRTTRRRPTASAWFPPIAITGSRLLRAELQAVQRDAGCEFDYAASIPEGRRYATRRPLIIIGTDLVARVRRPLTCRGLVVIASVNPPDTRVWEPTGRVGATYFIVLPTARDWLAHHLLRNLPT